MISECEIKWWVSFRIIKSCRVVPDLIISSWLGIQFASSRQVYTVFVPLPPAICFPVRYRLSHPSRNALMVSRIRGRCHDVWLQWMRSDSRLVRLRARRIFVGRNTPIFVPILILILILILVVSGSSLRQPNIVPRKNVVQAILKPPSSSSPTFTLCVTSVVLPTQLIKP